MQIPEQGCQILFQKGSDCPQIGQIKDFFRKAYFSSVRLPDHCPVLKQFVGLFFSDWTKFGHTKSWTFENSLIFKSP